MLVSRSFRVYTQWHWPNPVMLCSIEDDILRFPVWDPRKNPRDRTHHMPIITPAYPCMNSSYNVSESTLRVMMDQFHSGSKICEEIELNKAHWSSLFEPYPFFEGYRNYLQVDIIAKDTDDFRCWKGWVESRLRHLTLKIERDTLGTLQCHPYPNEYKDASRQCLHCALFIGLQTKQGATIQEGQQFDICAAINEFKHSAIMFSYWKPGMEIYISHVLKRHLPSFVFPDKHRRLRQLKRKRDGEVGNGKPDNPKKWASISSGNKAKGDDFVADAGSDVKLLKKNKDGKVEITNGSGSSNSSGITCQGTSGGEAKVVDLLDDARSSVTWLQAEKCEIDDAELDKSQKWASISTNKRECL